LQKRDLTHLLQIHLHRIVERNGFLLLFAAVFLGVFELGRFVFVEDLDLPFFKVIEDDV
jgi:hypothetical protein